MKRLFPIALVLTACASSPQAQLPTQAEIQAAVSSASSMELCESVYYHPRPIAEEAAAEAQRRGLNCQEFMPAIAQKRAGDQAARAAAVQMLMQRQQAPTYTPYQVPAPQLPKTTNCQTTRIGDTLHTNCR